MLSWLMNTYINLLAHHKSARGYEEHSATALLSSCLGVLYVTCTALTQRAQASCMRQEESLEGKKRSPVHAPPSELPFAAL